MTARRAAGAGRAVTGAGTAPTYWQVSRGTAYSLTFALPLIVLYELLALLVNRGSATGVRNAADMLLRRSFAALGGGSEVAFVAVVISVCVVLVVRSQRRDPVRLRSRVFVAMLAESMMLALAFGGVVSWATTAVLSPLAAAGSVARLPMAAVDGLSAAQALVVSLGAGLYEELVFRVLLVSAIAWAIARLRPGRPVVAAGGAVVASALLFSLFHYLGPMGDAWSLSSFTFRFIGGLAFSAIYVLRGFGIVAWTHALYDVFLLLL